MLYPDSEPLNTLLARYYRMNGLPSDREVTIQNNLDTSSLGKGLIAAWERSSGCAKILDQLVYGASGPVVAITRKPLFPVFVFFALWGLIFE